MYWILINFLQTNMLSNKLNDWIKSNQFKFRCKSNSQMWNNDVVLDQTRAALVGNSDVPLLSPNIAP